MMIIFTEHIRVGHNMGLLTSISVLLKTAFVKNIIISLTLHNTIASFHSFNLEKVSLDNTHISRVSINIRWLIYHIMYDTNIAIQYKHIIIHMYYIDVKLKIKNTKIV